MRGNIRIVKFQLARIFRKSKYLLKSYTVRENNFKTNNWSPAESLMLRLLLVRYLFLLTLIHRA